MACLFLVFIDGCSHGAGSVLGSFHTRKFDTTLVNTNSGSIPRPSSNFNLITMNDLKIKINQLSADKDQLLKDLRRLKKPGTDTISEELAELHAKVEWHNLFVDYVYDQNKNIYNEACEYADNNQIKI